MQSYSARILFALVDVLSTFAPDEVRAGAILHEGCYVSSWQSTACCDGGQPSRARFHAHTPSLDSFGSYHGWRISLRSSTQFGHVPFLLYPRKAIDINQQRTRPALASVGIPLHPTCSVNVSSECTRQTVWEEGVCLCSEALTGTSEALLVLSAVSNESLGCTISRLQRARVGSSKRCFPASS